MSRALQRLRATLGDELLVRDLRGYQLTPRAERIRGQLLAIMPTLDILFASEIVGAVRGVDPETGFNYDDTKRYIDAAGLSVGDRTKIFETNALTVFPRLRAALAQN